MPGHGSCAHFPGITATSLLIERRPCRGPDGKHARQRHDVDPITVRCLVQDRHRAIRQELEMQRVKSFFAIRILEEMTRYLIVTIYEMCEGALQFQKVGCACGLSGINALEPVCIECVLSVKAAQ